MGRARADAASWLFPIQKVNRQTWGLLVGAALVLASGGAVVWFERLLGVRSPSMLFLCAVILAASWFGQRVAMATAFAAFFVYNFYLVEPTYTFGLAGPDDILTLLVFVGAAILVGGVAGRLHDQRRRASRQAEIFRTLFSASRAMTEHDRAEDSFLELAKAAYVLSQTPVIVFVRPHKNAPVERICWPADAEAPHAIDDQAQALLEAHRDAPSDIGGWRIWRIAAPSGGFAALGCADAARLDVEHQVALRLLVDLASVCVNRLVTDQQRVEMDAISAAERLRSTLMASISHDFRTPLATIMASTSGLLAHGDDFGAETRRDMLLSIQEEADRLERFVGSILDMTRLEADALQVRPSFIDVSETLEAALDRIAKRLGGRRLDRQIPAASPSVRADPLLLEQSLVNVLENAITHTEPGAVIRAGCRADDEAVDVWIEDNGEGVAGPDLQHIFDKFYRVERPNNAVLGAGLGLAISKGFVEAMGGRIQASAPAHAPTGLRIVISFPRQASEQQP